MKDCNSCKLSKKNAFNIRSDSEVCRFEDCLLWVDAAKTDMELPCEDLSYLEL